MKKCKHWAADRYAPHWASAKACINLANPMVIVDVAKCASNLNPANVIKLQKTIKNNLKLANLIVHIKTNIIKCIIRHYGAAVIEKALGFCKKVKEGKAFGCPKSGIMSHNPYKWWCDKFMFVRKYACMVASIIL